MISSASVAWRAGTTNRANQVVVPARRAGNQFLGSLKGLQIWSLGSLNVFKYLPQRESNKRPMQIVFVQPSADTHNRAIY